MRLTSSRSCSCTDVIGHQVGPNAVEIEDTYLRLDKDFADFFNYLDQKVGKGNYTVFLSADHGGMNNAQFLLDRRIPAGDWNTKTAQKELNEMLKAKYPSADKLVTWVSNYQVFFDTQKIDSLGLDYAAIKQDAVNLLKKTRWYSMLATWRKPPSKAYLRKSNIASSMVTTVSVAVAYKSS